MAKITEKEKLAMVQERFSTALSSCETLRKDRENAQNFYYGRPLGNEIDGRSQVVSKVLMDTVEWTMPSLMRIFTTKQAVQFDPVGPEDEELAKQESAYTSHVLWKKNNGFSIIYQWLKDGLYQKVGYVIYWWEKSEKVCYETYTGLTQDQLALTIQGLSERGDVEIVAADIGQTGPGLPQYTDIKVKITEEEGKLRVEAIPPDEVIVSADCRGGVKNAKFAGRIRKMTRSDLMEMGFSRKELESVSDFAWSQTEVDMARDKDLRRPEADEGVDWATREMTLLECFTYLDSDGDGYAELRHFLVHGEGFLIDEECDEIQMCSWTPIIVPHKHAGIDLYDLTETDQRIDTGLTRSLLDNAYFGNNQRIIYDQNTVNVNMLQVNRPGGHVANDGPVVGSFAQLPVNDIASRLLPVIQHFESRRERSTGVGEGTTGVDADVLAQSTKGAYMQAVGAANQRMEAIARVFAETGLSDLYSSIHRMLMRHQDWPTRFKLKDDWVEVNPTEWKERANLSVSVGLGTAGKEEIRQNLGMMGQVMQTLAQVPGLVQAKNAYAYGLRMQEELGFEGEDFLTDPASQEYQQFMQAQGQQAPDPYLEGEKMKAQTRIQEKQIDSRDRAMDRAQERDLKITELEVKSGVDLAKAGIGAEVALARGNGPPGDARGRTPQKPDVQGSV